MNKKNILISVVFAVLSIAPFVATFLVFGDLPAKVPIHFDINGDVNRYGSKIEVFILPVITLIVGITSFCTLVFEKKIKSPCINRFAPATLVMNIVIMIVLNLLTLAILYVSYFEIKSIY